MRRHRSGGGNEIAIFVSIFMLVIQVLMILFGEKGSRREGE